MNEEIVDIPGYAGLYGVTRTGKIYSFNYKHSGKTGERKQQVCRTGRMMICLSKDGRVRLLQVHRLVAQTFIPNLDNKPEINHKDCNPKNNNVNNLEWVTRKENVRHAKRNGRYKRGEENPKAKITNKQALYINKLLDTNTAREVSTITGISTRIIETIKYGINWAHLTDRDSE